jgi:hypothetical protein
MLVQKLQQHQQQQQQQQQPSSDSDHLEQGQQQRAVFVHLCPLLVLKIISTSALARLHAQQQQQLQLQLQLPPASLDSDEDDDEDVSLQLVSSVLPLLWSRMLHSSAVSSSDGFSEVRKLAAERAGALPPSLVLPPLAAALRKVLVQGRWGWGWGREMNAKGGVTVLDSMDWPGDDGDGIGGQGGSSAGDPAGDAAGAGCLGYEQGKILAYALCHNIMSHAPSIREASTDSIRITTAGAGAGASAATAAGIHTDVEVDKGNVDIGDCYRRWTGTVVLLLLVAMGVEVGPHTEQRKGATAIDTEGKEGKEVEDEEAMIEAEAEDGVSLLKMQHGCIDALAFLVHAALELERKRLDLDRKQLDSDKPTQHRDNIGTDGVNRIADPIAQAVAVATKPSHININIGSRRNETAARAGGPLISEITSTDSVEVSAPALDCDDTKTAADGGSATASGCTPAGGSGSDGGAGANATDDAADNRICAASAASSTGALSCIEERWSCLGGWELTSILPTLVDLVLGRVVSSSSSSSSSVGQAHGGAGGAGHGTGLHRILLGYVHGHEGRSDDTQEVQEAVPSSLVHSSLPPLPLPLRICIGNVLLTVAQRCPVQGGGAGTGAAAGAAAAAVSGGTNAAPGCSLRLFALRVIPSLAPCASGRPPLPPGQSLSPQLNPSATPPPLVLRCAALRVISTVWARLQRPVGLSITDTHGLALDALRCTATPGSPRELDPRVAAGGAVVEVDVAQVRMCGLKLLGVVIGVAQQTPAATGSGADGDTRSLGLIAHLPPGAMMQTRTALQSAANMDSSAELRTLAQQLLQAAFAEN